MKDEGEREGEGEVESKGVDGDYCYVGFR